MEKTEILIPIVLLRVRDENESKERTSGMCEEGCDHCSVFSPRYQTGAGFTLLVTSLLLFVFPTTGMLVKPREGGIVGGSKRFILCLNSSSLCSFNITRLTFYIKILH
jgi:hypothetical protein